jgi:tRNA A37 threonylcarbamoyladenosine dehydratase
MLHTFYRKNISKPLMYVVDRVDNVSTKDAIVIEGYMGLMPLI